jgi:hypothetical protein
VNDRLTFDIYDTSGTYIYDTTITIIVPEGFYTAVGMAALLNTKFAALSGGTNPYVLDCSVGNTGLVFSIDDGHGILFDGIDAANTDASNNQNIRIYNVLGINAFNIYGSIYNTAVAEFAPLTVGAQQFVYCSAFQTNYTAYIDICSDTLTKYQSVKDNMTRPINNKAGVIARIYTTPFNQKEYTSEDLSQPTGLYKTGPYNIDTDYNNPKWIKWSPNEFIYTMDIQLYDQYGEFLYWTPEYSTEFDMTILASES